MEVKTVIEEVERALNLLLPLLTVPVPPGYSIDPMTWPQIREKAVSFGVAPLIASAASPFLPEEERDWCRRTLQSSWARHQRNLRCLEHAAVVLRQEHVDAIALKGPALALRAYDPPFLRKPSIDVDLLVKSGDTERACEALTRVGYRQNSGLAAARALHHHVAFTNPDGVRIELHWRLSHGPLGLEGDRLFERAVHYQLPGGAIVLIPCPADELFHLGLHLASDRFGSFFHLYEFRRLYRRQTASVRAEVLRRAVDSHYCGVFALIDLAFRSVWGEELLPEGFEMPKPWLHRFLDRDLYRAYETNMLSAHGRGARSRLYGRWLDFRITDRPWDALRLLVVMAKVALAELRGIREQGLA